jgi:hypothetical protein
MLAEARITRGFLTKEGIIVVDVRRAALSIISLASLVSHRYLIIIR